MQNDKLNIFFSLAGDDRPAIIKSDRVITFRDLFRESEKLAFLLEQSGISKTSHIPLLIEDNFSFIKTVIALWFNGAVPVPLNTRFLENEVNSILDDYDFKFLITDKISAERANPANTAVIRLNEIQTEFQNRIEFDPPGPQDESVVIFTSGSAGRPKGVLHTFNSLINSIRNGNDVLKHRKEDRWLASLPFYHIGGFQIICRSLYFGSALIIPDSLQTEDLTSAIIKQKPTHLSLVSTQLERLIFKSVKPDSSLRASLIGGGFIDDDLMLKADRLGWNPFRVYGSSETASFVTALKASEVKIKPLSAGRPAGNTEIKISSDSEILIKSASLFKKYIGDEKETSLKLTGGYYHTGDLGYIDKDGYLFIEARRNDLIVSGGENINPHEIERELLSLPFISDACVFPKQNKTWGQITAAAIVLNDSSVTKEIIREQLKQKLAGYKIPKEFFFTARLPRTSLGKLEREKIKKMF